MEQNKLWFELKATGPYATWPNQITLVVAMFDAEGTMISYLTTNDISPSYDAADSKKCHPRLKMVSRDDPGNNTRVRSIEFDLVATTFHTYPAVASIILGIWLPMCSSLSEFGRVGGEVRLIIGQKTSQNVPVSSHDFPLKWLGNKNACVVGCLIKKITAVRDETDPLATDFREDLARSRDLRPAALTVCKHWFFRYSTAVTVSNSSPDLLAIFKEESKQNRVLMLHQAYSGCIPLAQFLSAGQNVVVQDGPVRDAEANSWLSLGAGGVASKAEGPDSFNLPWTLASDQRKLEATANIESMQNPASHVSKILKSQAQLNNLDRWSVASLPFDKISFMLNYLNQRMDLQDQNLADFWKIVNFVKLEADFNDDQLAIVGALAERLEDYEHLLLQMYNSTAQRSLEFKELLSLGDGNQHGESPPVSRSRVPQDDEPLLRGSDGVLAKLTAASLAEVKTRANADDNLFEYERLVRCRQRDSSELASCTTRLMKDIYQDAPHRRRISAGAQYLLDDHPVQIEEERIHRKYFT